MVTVYIQRKKCVKKWNGNVPRMCLILFFICSLRTVQIACLVVASGHTCLSQPDVFHLWSKNCSNCMSCHCLWSYLSLTAWSSSSSTLALSLASFRASSLALLFSLSFCCLVNSALVVDFLNRSCHSCPSSPVAAAVDDTLSAEQLHAHDHQNVTEPQFMKQNLQICTIATQKVGQAIWSG